MILASSKGEPVKGNLRLQKLVFLLEKEIIEKKGYMLSNELYEFRPYNYGPYSEDVLDDVELLKDLGLITTGTNEKEFYKITNKGIEVLNRLIEKNPNLKNIMSEIENLKKRWNNVPLKKLLQYVYRKYPEYTEKSLIKHLILS